MSEERAAYHITKTIDKHFTACRATSTTTALEAALAEARAELSEVEYWLLLGRLSSASNEEYERAAK